MRGRMGDVGFVMPAGSKPLIQQDLSAADGHAHLLCDGLAQGADKFVA
jgi:hypothetical protein